MLRLLSLKKHSDFSELKKQEAFFSRYFILQVEPLSESDTLFYGIVASKKIGNAVRRNKTKRRMRSLFRDFVKLNPTATGARIVMIAKHRLLTSTYADILKELIHGCINKEII